MSLRLPASDTYEERKRRNTICFKPGYGRVLYILLRKMNSIKVNESSTWFFWYNKKS